MDASTQGRANRRRGADAERAVVRYLRGYGWPDCRRYLAGDGNQPGDLDWHPLFCVEVKDVAATAWPTWCKQAAEQCKPGLTPIVVRRERGQTDVGEWLCRVDQRAWEENVGRWMHLCPVEWVNERPWCLRLFGSLVDEIWQLDHPCYLPDGAA